jgi:hypothetical protein
VLERLEGVLVERGLEDHQRARIGKVPHDVEAVDLGHRDVEEQHVGALRGHAVEGLESVRSFPRHFHIQLFEHGVEAGPRRGFVVDDEHSHVRLPPAGRASRPSSRSAVEAEVGAIAIQRGEPPPQVPDPGALLRAGGKSGAVIGDRQAERVAIPCRRDGKTAALESCAEPVLERVLDQRLEQERRERQAPGVIGDGPRNLETLAVALLLHGEIGLQVLELLVERARCATGSRECPPQHVGEVLDRAFSRAGIGPHQRRHGVERVEEKVWIHLGLERCQSRVRCLRLRLRGERSLPLGPGVEEATGVDHGADRDHQQPDEERQDDQRARARRERREIEPDGAPEQRAEALT